MMSLCDCEVKEWSVLVRVGCPFLIPRIRSHRMRTKPRAHTAIIHSCVILVSHHLGKKQTTICILFQNVGGLIPTMDGDLKLTILCHFTQQSQINVLGFVEHNICWDLLPKHQQLAERTRGWWENAHWTTDFNK